MASSRTRQCATAFCCAAVKTGRLNLAGRAGRPEPGAKTRRLNLSGRPPRHTGKVLPVASPERGLFRDPAGTDALRAFLRDL